MCAAVVVALLTVADAAQAQSFGIGGRFSFVRADADDADTDSQRFTGGHIRAGLSPRSSFELSLDVRTDDDPTETVRIRQFPIQASLLLYPVRSVISPYLLGGAGWYASRVELRSGSETISSETTREFGWHAGFGGELKLGSHAAAHADYRYTFLDFGDDDEDEEEGILTRFLPGHRGSMWTAGITIYF
jgi:opacity protein-like surface antigen